MKLGGSMNEDEDEDELDEESEQDEEQSENNCGGGQLIKSKNVYLNRLK